MSGQPKSSHPLNGVHTAGIFADLSVDGPIIGTLVAIVDRARNLPNRKTIGKQDPYCAARLGKEAKKTATDIRGGQTPKWDQELRFTVHDSPDYYQLKVSVFTDDKKTDLVGESWIDLRNIIVPGGGQNDVWQTLTCRSKYAGEIRIEITYYDQRPKAEKPVAAPSPAAADQESGSVRQKKGPRRRPLPSDPVTGEAPPAAPPVASAAPTPDHNTPPRAHGRQSSHSGYIPNQSPLQAVEYHNPPPQPRARGSRDMPSSPHGNTPPNDFSTPPRGEGPRGTRRSMNPYDGSPGPQDDRDYSPRYSMHQQDQGDYRGHYSPHRNSREPSPMEEPFPSIEDDRPPPPPAHRSRHNSGGQELVPRGTYDASPPKSSHPMRHDVLRNEAHRHSSPSYPGRPTFREYDSTPPPNSLKYDSSPRHSSYDANYDPHHRSLQPTVEDVPDSMSPHSNAYRQSTRLQEQDELFDEVPPLNLSRSPGASPYRDERSVSPGYQHDPNSYQVAVSPSRSRGYSQSPGHAPRSSGASPGYRNDHDMVVAQNSSDYVLQDLPPALVPGLDPALSREVTDGVYEDRRSDRRSHSQSMVLATPPRGRPRDDHYSPSYNQPLESSPSYALQKYDRRPVAYTGGHEDYAMQRRSVSPNPRTSPNPQQTIRRKSVSPAPPPNEPKMLTDVPFGPDSFDALNPSLVSSREAAANGSPDYLDLEEERIITHDGREIDPSDHLPMETWAPEPDRKNKEPPQPETRTRPALSGAQPLPPSTRRTARATRHSMSAAPTYGSFDDPHTPPNASRTRLQKRGFRASMGPGGSGGPGGPAPLAPIAPDNYQDRQMTYTPPNRGPPRTGSWDHHQNENHAPMYNPGPPIPAKIPLPLMSGANGGHEEALMEEMQRIDIGQGRSRRRGGY